MKGKGKGPLSMAACPDGGLLAVDHPHQCRVFHWPAAGFPARVRRGVGHAALLAWEQCHGAADVRLEAAPAVAIDNLGRLCAWDREVLLRQAPGAAAEVVARERGLVAEAQGGLDFYAAGMAVSGDDWFLIQHATHRVFRWRLGDGIEVVAGQKGQGTGPGQLCWPNSVAVRRNCFFITDDPRPQQGRLLKFPREGAEAVLLDDLDSPRGLVLLDDVLLIGESGGRRILSFHVDSFPNL